MLKEGCWVVVGWDGAGVGCIWWIWGMGESAIFIIFLIYLI